MTLLVYLHQGRSFSVPQVIGKSMAGMLVVMAVNAEVFPVAAVRWVEIVIAVLVMNREEMHIACIELAATLGTDRAVNP
jgi:hypothetical protein